VTGLLQRSAAIEVVPGVVLREVAPGDLAAVRDFLAGLSLDSAYRRFFTGIGSPPTAALVRRLVDADPERRSVVLAVAGAEVIGVADTTLVDGGRAVELGVVVADRWQRRGLGWPLCAAALTPALTRGVPVLRAHTLPDNARVARLLRRHWPDGSPRFDDGTLIWELPLRPENVLGD
jgi:RimJ/RimL family protein N-acetyltransferase